jgi:hypothetical protein
LPAIREREKMLRTLFSAGSTRNGDRSFVSSGAADHGFLSPPSSLYALDDAPLQNVLKTVDLSLSEAVVSVLVPI